MNTLLGQLGTYNDIKYPRYRFAFKLRKLQTTFIFHQLEVRVLQDIFYSIGIQALPREHEITETQLSTVISEIFAALHSSLQGQVNAETIEEAHTTCFNWLLLACMTSDTNAATGTVGILKTFLILFSGSKIEDKAKYLFEILATDGAVGLDGLQFFCEAIELVANSIQESVYPDIQSTEQLARAMSDSLSYVHNSTDDEETNSWLSSFDFVKVFTASPPLKFLSWLDLWTILPTVEKVIHPVKCKICNKKRFRGFRYQCEDCDNYHMCQMCFLKGRTSHNHHKEHKVVECQDYTMTLRTRLGLSHSTSKVYRVMDEPQDMHVQIRLTSQDLTDSIGLLDYPIHHFLPPPAATPELGRRSVGGSPYFDKRRSRVSYISVDSLDNEDSGYTLERASISHASETLEPAFFSLPRKSRPRQKIDIASGSRLIYTKSCEDITRDENEKQLTEINKRLSQDVDRLLDDLMQDVNITVTDENGKQTTTA